RRTGCIACRSSANSRRREERSKEGKESQKSQESRQESRRKTGRSTGSTCSQVIAAPAGTKKPSPFWGRLFSFIAAGQLLLHLFDFASARSKLTLFLNNKKAADVLCCRSFRQRHKQENGGINGAQATRGAT